MHDVFEIVSESNCKEYSFMYICNSKVSAPTEYGLERVHLPSGHVDLVMYDVIDVMSVRPVSVSRRVVVVACVVGNTWNKTIINITMFKM